MSYRMRFIREDWLDEAGAPGMTLDAIGEVLGHMVGGANLTSGSDDLHGTYRIQFTEKAGKKFLKMIRTLSTVKIVTKLSVAGLSGSDMIYGATVVEIEAFLENLKAMASVPDKKLLDDDGLLCLAIDE